MAARGTLGFVTSRAATRRSAVAALLVSVLVICTLVTTLITAMGPLTQTALSASISALPPDDSVVEVTTAYDRERPEEQTTAVQQALGPVIEPLGGQVVSRAEGVSFDLLGNSEAVPGVDYFPFSTLTGAADQLSLAEGRRARPGSFETVVPKEVAATFGISVGDRLRMRNRYDGGIIRPTVVGIWLPPEPDQLRSLSGMLGAATADTSDEAADTGSGNRWAPMLTSPESFASVAGPVPSIKWRAVPDLARATTEDLPALADAASRLPVELEAAEAETGGSLRVTNPLPEVVEGQQRAVAVFRSLLLVPAVLLLILGLVGLTMVAGLLAGSREGEETLLRSRGASPWQLVRPTMLESVACGALGAVVGPLVAAGVGPIDGVGGLGLSGWLTGAGSGVACAAALALPSAVRALSRRGERADPSPKERRRRLTGLAFGLLLVVALGLTAVAQLLRYETVGSAGTGISVDPLLVASPGLVLVTGCVLLTLAAIPLARLLTTVTGGMPGLAAPLSTRSVARAAGSAIPLMVVVASGTGIVWFAAFQETSQAEARATRATYTVGADLRMQQPATGAGDSLQTAQALRSIDGVRGAMPVRTDTMTVDGEQVDVVMADLTTASGTALDPATFDFAPTTATTRRLVDRSWSSADTGVEVPAGTQTLAVRFDQPDARVSAVALLADARDTITSVRLERAGPRLLRQWPEGLPGEHRLVGLEVTAEFGDCRLPDPPTQRLALSAVRVDGRTHTPAVRWASGPGADATEIVHNCSAGRAASSTGVIGAPADQELAPPAAISHGLAQAIDVDTGDEVRFSLDNVTLDLTVAAVLPVISSVEDGREGILLDRGTIAPTLLQGGHSISPTAWWIATEPSAGATTTEKVRAQFADGALVTTRQQVLDELADDPGTGGAGLATSLRWTALGGGVVCLLLLSAAALLRRGERARQAGVLRALGAGQRSVVGVIGGEYALTAGLGAVVGAVVGTGVAALVLPVVTLGPGGVALTPPPLLSAPWVVVLPATAALLLAPLVLVLVLARTDARGAMVTDLRTLEHG